jgi:hypothetical protein
MMPDRQSLIIGQFHMPLDQVNGFFAMAVGEPVFDGVKGYPDGLVFIVPAAPDFFFVVIRVAYIMEQRTDRRGFMAEGMMIQGRPKPPVYIEAVHAKTAFNGKMASGAGRRRKKIGFLFQPF